jgi:plasmid stabilization system protein ParE
MRIRWTEPAVRDLTNICDYTEDHDGPEAARRVALRIHERPELPNPVSTAWPPRPQPRHP